MDLYGGQPLWTAFSGPPQFAGLAANEVCDVAIIGAGVTGALMAWELARRGIDTVVVDKRDACMGSTVACTALVQYEIDCTLMELTERLGWEHASGAYRACRRALDDLANLEKQIGGCDLLCHPSLFLAKQKRDAKKLREESCARQKIGLEVSFLSAGELKEQFGIERPAALLSKIAYAADPLKLTSRLLQGAARLGARIYAKTTAQIELGSHGRHILRTPGGHTVRCKHLVIASGYETPEQFEVVRNLCQLKSTYAFATTPMKGAEPWPRSALLWELADPYSYARVTSDRRIIVGGEDEDFVAPKKRDALLPSKLERLEQNLRGLFPQMRVTVEYGWAGTFAQTRDGLPYIGATPHYSGCFFALGYGGNGITFSVLAAQIIADMIEGIPNKDANLFDFDRCGSG